jgi:hypothetical protein
MQITALSRLPGKLPGLIVPLVDTVLAQYVIPSKLGLFRIIRHGHRWRSLLDERELGRHTAASAALTYLRDTWPRARLPMTLDRWRYLPGPMQTGLTVHISLT